MAALFTWGPNWFSSIDIDYLEPLYFLIMLSENQQKNLKLAIICILIGVAIYAAGWADYLWLSLLISMGLGFTTRYSKIWLNRLRPQAPLWMQYFLSGLIAVGLWGLLPLGLRYRQLVGSSSEDLSYYLPALLTIGLSTLIISYVYYSRERFFLLQQALDKAEVARVKKDMEALEIRLRLLQSQIEPHFLFNSLANIQALIHIEPKQASKMLLALTSLLRQSLKRTRQEWAVLADELSFNKAYLAIQEIRLGERLRVHFDISDRVRNDLLFPPMLLQPLIENAVVHGIEPLGQGGELHLTITVADQLLLIELYNDGSLSQQPTGHQGHHVGLKNTRERLHQLYGKAASFSIREQAPRNKEKQSGVLVKMEVPCHYPTAL